MRTTLTLDDDVANLLQSEIRRSGQPFKQTVNRLLRTGLRSVEIQASPKPFKVRGAIQAGVPKEWTSGCVQELLDLLDRPDTINNKP